VNPPIKHVGLSSESNTETPPQVLRVSDVWWTRAFWILAGFHVVAWTLIPLFVYSNVSLDVAEITSYGHELQLGYFKHPPLASWVMEAGRRASGQQAIWAIYLTARLVVVAAFFGVWRLARRLVNPPNAFMVVLALEASFAYTIEALDFNHIVMVLPFFTLSGWCLYAALSEGDMGWWIAVGVVVGLGMLSNHIMLFQAITIAIFICADPTSRPWLKRPHPYIAALTAILVFIPNLYWLVQNHFAPVRYIQHRYAVGSGLTRHLLFPLSFSFWQVAYLGSVALALAPWTGRWRCRVLVDSRERWNGRFLIVTVLGPFLGFMLLSVVGGLSREKNVWGLPFWLFSPLLMLFFLRPSPAPFAFRHTIVVALALIGVNLTVGVTRPLFWPILTGRPMPRTQFPGRLLSKKVGLIWHERFPNTPLRIVAGERWLSNNVAFYSEERPSVLTDEASLWLPEIDESSCPWTSVSQLHKYGGILLWYADLDGLDLPPGLRRFAPGAHVVGALSLPWQTNIPFPPVRVGVAVLPPEAGLSGNPSAINRAGLMAGLRRLSTQN
jgi:Dolichyl-phosphate-mannose-protein mannosyltransferase